MEGFKATSYNNFCNGIEYKSGKVYVLVNVSKSFKRSSYFKNVINGLHIFNKNKKPFYVIELDSLKKFRVFELHKNFNFWIMKPMMCNYGFHFCEKPENVLNYYRNMLKYEEDFTNPSMKHHNNNFYKVCALNDTYSENNKSVTNVIHICYKFDSFYYLKNLCKLDFFYNFEHHHDSEAIIGWAFWYLFSFYLFMIILIDNCDLHMCKYIIFYGVIIFISQNIKLLNKL
jgi:hypothetical protein